MRGEIWAFDVGGGADPLPLAVVQAEALNGTAPTVVGLVVTSRPQPAGEPLVVALDDRDTGLRGPAWVKVTQVHTVPVADARRRLGVIPADLGRRLDAALAEVLGLGGGAGGGPGSPGRASGAGSVP